MFAKPYNFCLLTPRFAFTIGRQKLNCIFTFNVVCVSAAQQIYSVHSQRLTVVVRKPKMQVSICSIYSTHSRVSYQIRASICVFSLSHPLTRHPPDATWTCDNLYLDKRGRINKERKNNYCHCDPLSNYFPMYTKRTREVIDLQSHICTQALSRILTCEVLVFGRGGKKGSKL